MNIIQLYDRFPTEKDCINHLEHVRWRGKPTCPYCSSAKSTAVAGEKRYHCNICNTSYSATVGTIFHHSHLPLQKWFLALTLVLNAKNTISSRQLARALDVNRNTACYMQLRIRNAMIDQRSLLYGVIGNLDSHACLTFNLAGR